MTSSKATSGKHKIYEVKAWEGPFTGTKYFSVYWMHGGNGLKYVFPNIAARDELDAYTITMKKLEEGADKCLLTT
jgi:hypothetical protein